ncbi:receptor expression-enhancing protein 6 isoform X2 [Calypte anna]|uniref:receptor expression-enhancing protein 6 isoform X2 n=1 Tax=Calypte anna TaxID=9244 RepID=UPI0011C3AEB3|nr:receptor expression-enhancing protein 6 isoform X2 [Calypte anna]
MGSVFTCLRRFLRESGPLGSLLSRLEARTGIKWLYLAPVSLALLGLYLVFGYGASLISNLFGFIYPAYASIKAIESSSKEEDTLWLTYWVLYGTFSIAEAFSDVFLFWFPCYYGGKCLFLLWCMAPVPWNGSQVLYQSIIRPCFLKHRRAMDSILGTLGTRTLDTASQITQEAPRGALNLENKLD